MYVLMDEGMSISAIRCQYGTCGSMMQFIKRNKGKLRESIRVSASSDVEISCVSHHDPFLQGMEIALCVWLEDGDGGCHDAIEVGV